jgi:lipopolysaccharide export system protein LptC
MSDAATLDRDKRIVWARPGSSHDRLIRALKLVLPVVIGALAAVLIIAPLAKRSEISFLLAKDKVDLAKERMRVSEALYRGEDAKGHPFSLHAGGAVQKTSKVPIVEMQDLSARITLDDGPAVLRTPNATYDMDREVVRAPGALLFESSDGYRMTTRGVGIDLKARQMKSDGAVEGRMPIGTFTGDHMTADLNARTVSLNGRARLHIVQGAARGR